MGFRYNKDNGNITYNSIIFNGSKHFNGQNISDDDFIYIDIQNNLHILDVIMYNGYESFTISTHGSNSWKYDINKKGFFKSDNTELTEKVLIDCIKRFLCNIKEYEIKLKKQNICKVFSEENPMYK